MQTSWLCTSKAEELNSDYRETTTPASDQSGIWTRGDRVEIQRPKPLGHAASH